MKYFFTADTHFHHANIIKYCNRPFGHVDNMDMYLIKNWNNIVTQEDTIFILGDFAFKYFNRLNNVLYGNKIFIKGNHDKKGIISDIFIDILNEKWLLTHSPYEDYPRIIHGHIHNKWKIKKEKNKIMINVGVDVWDYKPVELKQIIDLIKENETNRIIERTL